MYMNIAHHNVNDPLLSQLANVATKARSLRALLGKGGSTSGGWH
jgi:hypothetical protein